MTERKTMGDAMGLPNKTLEFIKAGKVGSPKPDRTAEKTIDLSINSTAEISPDSSEADATEESKTLRRSRKRTGVAAKQVAEPRDFSEILVSTSFRLRYNTVEALNEAWLDRKRLNRRAKLQDIAQEAVDEWLKRHGYAD
jgi:hypothetical protein